MDNFWIFTNGFAGMNQTVDGVIVKMSDGVYPLLIYPAPCTELNNMLPLSIKFSQTHNLLWCQREIVHSTQGPEHPMSPSHPFAPSPRPTQWSSVFICRCQLRNNLPISPFFPWEDSIPLPLTSCCFPSAHTGNSRTSNNCPFA